jgi:hypothetical protein
VSREGGAPARARLPNRRACFTRLFAWRDDGYMLSVGMDDQGRAREVFVDGPKQGSDMEAIIDDACVLLSILLQHGESAAEVYGHLGREGVFVDGVPPEALEDGLEDLGAASIIGEIARQVVAEEASAGPVIRDLTARIAAQRAERARLAAEAPPAGEG